ncbi:DDE-type integrase/transposase/recombinase [Nesterenkonia halotolerans]|uniref:Transposase InsO family protein n=1 Tax=Nesterenkonia halotolerans TaxID=225325 RepID=A0ABR9J863_9MICC|nr:DDE-type integrase/transposase/recombinase [Nesterenkonia halotolerans]MBE1515194.1 transposase InsO family protein [Nesterenkonia halotolerans]
MTSEILDIFVGAGLWHDGAAWTVVELDGTTVVLRSGEHFKRAHAPSLIGQAEPLQEEIGDQDPHSELDVVLLSGLSKVQRERLEAEARIYDELVLTETGLPLEQKYRQAGTMLGASSRTVRRRAIRYAERGLAGLIDARRGKPHRRSVAEEWDQACMEVLKFFATRSNPTRRLVLHKTNALYLERYPDAHVPSQAVAYRRLQELDKGRYTFGSAKQRRSVADRPKGVLGRLSADRPGQYVVLDTTRLDVFAMEPATGRWLNTELTIAMDLYSRCILGLALRAVSTTAQDVSSVLYQVVTPQQWGMPAEDRVPAPYAGVPDTLITQSTGALPDTIVVDHGKVYLAARTKAVCHRLGINIQPATPHKPTDKPTVERFFRTLRQQLLERLPAYKGPDVHSRGKDVENEAFYTVPELETIIREWVGIYHHTAHKGLCDPRIPDVVLSPAEMFSRGVAASGVLRLPASQSLRMEFLDVVWRTIQHYGVEINGRRYDGPALNLYRGSKSQHGGAHGGKWPIMVDHDDVRTAYFQDPDTHLWHDLEWDQAAGLDAPFSAEAADYTRRLTLKTDRHINPDVALQDLMQRYSKGAVTDKREKNLARRSASTLAPRLDATEPTRPPESEPEVIDLIAHLDQRRAHPPMDDDLDVFDRAYADDPEGTIEVFDV